MEKISINLLPPEIEVSAQQKSNKDILVTVSISLLVLSIVVSAIMLGFELYQKSNLSKTEQNLKELKNQVALLDEEEKLNFVLKNRLQGISTIYPRDIFQSKSYNFLTSLIPQDLRFLVYSVNRTGKASVSGDTISNPALGTFFDRLTDPASNEGRINTTNIDSLSLVQNGRIRFDLTIVLKE